VAVNTSALMPKWVQLLLELIPSAAKIVAQQEGKVERHIRLLIPLAFTPPQTLAAIVAGSGSTDLTVTALSQAIPYAWRSKVAPTQA
jgi:hypothetical protein